MTTYDGQVDDGIHGEPILSNFILYIIANNQKDKRISLV